MKLLTSLALLVTASLSFGYIAMLLPRRSGRFLAWTVTLVGVGLAESLCRGQLPVVRMLALIVAGFLGMKAVVVVEEVNSGMPAPSVSTWLAFACLWAGMRPRLFAEPYRPDPKGGLRLAAWGGAWFFAGATLVATSGPLYRETQSLLLVSGWLLVGISWLLHFGALNVIAGLWRLRGVACEPLFDAPLMAQNLSDFWGRRWNLAFSEMTALGLYRPLQPVVGKSVALAAAFLLSGLLHEMAISLPVEAGYGRPTAYFMLHGLLVWVERCAYGRGVPVTGRLGWMWTVGWLLAPLPWLFHREFLAALVWPLAGIG